MLLDPPLPMDCPKFLRMKSDNFPDDVITMYNLMDKVDAKGFHNSTNRKGYIWTTTRRYNCTGTSHKAIGKARLHTK